MDRASGGATQPRPWNWDGGRQTGVVTLVDWFLRDRRTGEIVIAQRPNAPLLVGLAASGARALLDLDGGWSTTLWVGGTAALGWWSVDEIARGVNPWRRLLGAGVLAGLVASLLR